MQNPSKLNLANVTIIGNKMFNDDSINELLGIVQKALADSGIKKINAHVWCGFFTTIKLWGHYKIKERLITDILTFDVQVMKHKDDDECYYIDVDLYDSVKGCRVGKDALNLKFDKSLIS